MNAYDQSNCSEDYLWKYHFGTVFVKEDRDTGKVEQKPCLFKRQSRSVRSVTPTGKFSNFDVRFPATLTILNTQACYNSCID